MGKREEIEEILGRTAGVHALSPGVRSSLRALIIFA